jgi:hypothetical protein
VRLNWHDPVLVHLTNSDETVRDGGKAADAHSGHYVVWMPGSEDPGVVHLWCGLDGFTYQSERKWSQRRSGAVLLTSSNPIDYPGEAVERERPSIARWGIPLSVLSLLAIVLSIFLRGRRLSALRGFFR